jgi:hypothetical protein
VLQAGAGRTADHGYDEPRAQAGRLLEEQGDRTQQHVGRLERLEPAGEQHHVRIERQPQVLTRGVSVAWTEDGEVHAGVDHLDAARVGVVQVDQLLGLDVGARDQHVRGLDDLLLPDDPGRRLRGVARGERLVLHLGHRVHGVHERDPPTVARQRADLAGEPVVGVNEVVVAERLRGLGAQHLAREHAQLTRQLALGQALERAGVDVAHRDPVVHRQDRVELRRGGAREDVDLDARRGQAPGELDHVDVEATGVAGAGLVQR